MTGNPANSSPFDAIVILESLSQLILNNNPDSDSAIFAGYLQDAAAAVTAAGAYSTELVTRYRDAAATVWYDELLRALVPTQHRPGATTPRAITGPHSAAEPRGWSHRGGEWFRHRLRSGP